MNLLRNRFLTSLVGLGALAASATAQSTVYVDALLTTGANDGTSWADALQGVDSLQTAMVASVAGDVIYAADGLYLPSNTGLRGASFRMRDGVEVYGGFLGGEATPADRPPFDTAPSILSGDLMGNDVPGGGGVNENSYHVVRSAGNDSSAILDGFRVIGGNANVGGNNRDRGGGILVINNSTGVIRNCRFLENRCTFGGGAGYVNGAPTFLNTTFESNLGGSFGGAFDIAGSGAILFDGCTFLDNTAVRAGGLEIFSTNGARVLNCLFVGNRSTGSGGGGGLWIGANSNAQVRNCTIVGNISQQQAGGITVSSSNPSIINCILWDNQNNAGTQNPANQVTQSANVTYSIVEGGMAGTGNTGGDPDFADAPAGDYTLGLASAGVDAGSNSGLPAGFVLDLAGNPRFVDEVAVADTGNGTAPIIDMGALERQAGGIGMGDPGCMPVPNSTGVASELTASGSLSVAANDLDLAVSDLPDNQFAYFVMSETTGSAPVGSGILCLGAPFYRFTSNVLNSGTTGAVAFSPDFTNLPQAQVFLPGDTWYFQLWHRDVGGTSNLSNNLGFTWQ